MYELTIVQRCQLGRHGCFFVDDEDPDWARFCSAKPRFPLTVALPRTMAGPKLWGRFNPHGANYQELEFPSNFIAAHHDLTNDNRTTAYLLSAPLLDYDPDATYRQRKCGRSYRIGGLRDTPSCIRYDNGAVRVWFQPDSRELWSFERSAHFDDDLFARILESVGFLQNRFFDQLPAPAEGLECHHEWETLYFYAPQGGVFMKTLGVDCDVDELARRWPGELRAVFHQRVSWSRLEHAIVDMVVTRPNITRTQLYDALVLAGYRLQAVHDAAQAVSGNSGGWLRWSDTPHL